MVPTALKVIEAGEARCGIAVRDAPMRDSGSREGVGTKMSVEWSVGPALDQLSPGTRYEGNSSSLHFLEYHSSMTKENAPAHP